MGGGGRPVSKHKIDQDPSLLQAAILLLKSIQADKNEKASAYPGYLELQAAVADELRKPGAPIWDSVTQATLP